MPRFDVELLTPAFPGGYEQNKNLSQVRPEPGDAPYVEIDGVANEQELDGVRPAAIIYGCRWWFRAIAGGILGSTSLTQIREAESLIFGTAQPLPMNPDAQGRPQPIASRISVVVEREAYVVGQWGAATEPKLTLQMRYLSYGLYDANRNVKFVRRYLKAGSQFSFRLDRVSCSKRLQPFARLKDGVKSPPEPTDALVESLAKLWIQFGGLGARWRHGLGSMQLVGEVIPPQQMVKKAMELLQVAVKEVRSFLKLTHPGFAAVPDVGVPEFPAIAGANFQLATKEPFPTAERALEQVVQTWREYRKVQPGNPRSSSRNARLYREFMERDSVESSKVEFAALGLPIPFSFRQIPALENMTGSIRPGEEYIERRASPIWFRVKRLQQGSSSQFGLIAFLWNSRFLPGSGTVVIDVKEPGYERDALVLTADPGEAARFFAQDLLKKQRWNNR